MWHSYCPKVFSLARLNRASRISVAITKDLTFHVIGVLEGKKKEDRAEKVRKKTIAENFQIIASDKAE